jgi:hypothetical protein
MFPSQATWDLCRQWSSEHQHIVRPLDRMLLRILWGGRDVGVIGIKTQLLIPPLYGMFELSGLRSSCSFGLRVPEQERILNGILSSLVLSRSATYNLINLLFEKYCISQFNKHHDCLLVICVTDTSAIALARNETSFKKRFCKKFAKIFGAGIWKLLFKSNSTIYSSKESIDAVASQ